MKGPLKILRRLFIVIIRRLGFPVAAQLGPSAKARRDKYIEKMRRLDRRPSFKKALDTIYAGAGGFDERVVEYPVFSSYLREVSRDAAPRVLDVGMTLNNSVISSDLEENVASLTFLNPNPDQRTIIGRPSAVVKDRMHAVPELRDAFDLVVSVSTIEHIGWSNLQYGDTTPRFLNRPAAVHLELFLWFANYCLVPGGSFFLSVPIGRSMRNLHPNTLKWSSQTFSRSQMKSTIQEAEALGFKVGFKGLYVKDGDWVPGTMDTPEMWNCRYGRPTPAASAVGFLWGKQMEPPI